METQVIEKVKISKPSELQNLKNIVKELLKVLASEGEKDIQPGRNHDVYHKNLIKTAQETLNKI